MAPWDPSALREVPDRFAFAGVAFELGRTRAAPPLRLPTCLGHPMPAAPSPPAGVVRLRLETDPELPRDRGRRAFEAREHGGGLWVRWGRGEVRLRREARGVYDGTARVPPDTGGAAEMDLLQAVAGTVVADRGGTVLHAAAVVLDGRACSFVGPPDAGKSTACAHTGAPLMAIDRVALVPDGAGRFVAWAVPGGPEDEHSGDRAQPPVAPAGWILRVVQAQGTVRAHLLPPARASMVIRAAMQWPLVDPRGQQRALETAARLVAGIPTGEIHTVLGHSNAPAIRALPSPPR